ncbi:hypothetical protein [Haladaptatus sp. NG-WS-4]
MTRRTIVVSDQEWGESRPQWFQTAPPFEPTDRKRLDVPVKQQGDESNESRRVGERAVASSHGMVGA